MSGCDGLVKQALADRMVRVGVLGLVGTLTPVAVNGIRTLQLPKNLKPGEGTTGPNLGTPDELLADADFLGQSVGKSAATSVGVDAGQLAELAAKGVKFTEKNVIATGRDANGKLIFLESGSSSAGLQHILERHAGDFLKKGIPASEVPTVVMKALTDGTVVGVNGSAPVYEIVHNGVTQHIAVGVGSNGYVVRANPVSTWKLN